MKVSHVLLPCKLNSTRIFRKNLALIGGMTILELAIARSRRWFPSARVWVATDDAEATLIAERQECAKFSLTEADINDKRNVSELMTEFLSLRRRDERCICFQLTSPFTFRSELGRAVADERPFVRSAFMGTLHLATADKQSNGWMKLSQHLEPTICLTGNFLCANGQHVITPGQECSCLTPVSLFSALDINTPDDLKICQTIGGKLRLDDMDD
ncbi:MAG: hypothetical protein V4719_07520 [Planctomycetota bacterium]